MTVLKKESPGFRIHDLSGEQHHRGRAKEPEKRSVTSYKATAPNEVTMAVIEEIEWLDRGSGEAQVSVRSYNNFCIDCFAFLFDGEVGDKVSCTLSVLDAKNAVKVESCQYTAIKTRSPFCYHIIAKILDVGNAIVQLDDILIDVESALYGDAKAGDYVALDISRFDLIGETTGPCKYNI